MGYSDSCVDAHELRKKSMKFLRRLFASIKNLNSEFTEPAAILKGEGKQRCRKDSLVAGLTITLA
jgi:hypothetical protein